MSTSTAMEPAVLQLTSQAILACKICQKKSVGKIVPGEGSFSIPIVILGEAPGKQEVKTGRPFIGPAGRVLNRMFDCIGLDRNKVFITSVVKYLPKHITPKPSDIDHGLEHLNQQLQALKPDYILALGKIAFLALSGTEAKISDIRGQLFDYGGIACFPTYHPASALYNPSLLKILEQDIRQFSLIAQLKT
jgi:DNA polymerase